ncbi:MAG: hypothetical protein ACYC1D_11185 [Acidimicrobiales bacterium]
MKTCDRSRRPPVNMSVTLSFEVAPGVLSDLLAAKLLMNLLSELTADGINATHIGLAIEGYQPSEQP